MRNTQPQLLKQKWLPLLVNGVGIALGVRTTWMIRMAPLHEGWVLFTDSALLHDIVVFTGSGIG